MAHFDNSAARIVLVVWDLSLLSEPTSSPNLSIITMPALTSIVVSGLAVSGSGNGSSKASVATGAAPAGQWFRRTP